MRNQILVALAVLGVALGLWSVHVMQNDRKVQPPAFTPASNPYEKGIYANGIVEAFQSSGENINVYPDVSGAVTKVLVSEGDTVDAGTVLFHLDDSVPQATANQQKAQADLAQAQIGVAEANLKTVQDQLDKQQAAAAKDPKLVSKDVLDNARNAVAVARANLQAAKQQYEVMVKTHDSALATLDKYQIRALSTGTILTVNVAPGSYVSNQGVYDSYTSAQKPALVMGNLGKGMAVRCYIDEILIHRLPDMSHAEARMIIRGTEVSVPLKFVRVQPNVSPKIELSSQRAERVDVRVLPVIFSFDAPKDVPVFPGQLVDVYINEQTEQGKDKKE